MFAFKHCIWAFSLFLTPVVAKVYYNALWPFPNDVAVPANHENCNYAPEVLFLVSASSLATFQHYPGESSDKARDLVKYLFPVVRDFQIRFGDAARIGLASFRDKPVSPFGEQGDYCARIEVPLPAIGEKTNLPLLRDTLEKLQHNGGGDYMDGALDALTRVASSNTVGWSKEKIDPISKKPIKRIIVVYTEALPHMKGSGGWGNVNHHSVSDTHFEPLVKYGVNEKCSMVDYPALKDVHAALDSRSISLIVLSWTYPQLSIPHGKNKAPFDLRYIPREAVVSVAHTLSKDEAISQFSRSPERITNFYREILKKHVGIPAAFYAYNASYPLNPAPGEILLSVMERHFIPESCGYSKTYLYEGAAYEEDDEISPNRVTQNNAKKDGAVHFLVAGGVGAVVVAAGLGVAGFRWLSGAATPVTPLPFSDVEADVAPQVTESHSTQLNEDREQYEAVTNDLFS